MPVALRTMLTIACALLAAPALAEPPAPPTQYVVISFDGAQPIAQWQRSRALARRAGASFTYFLSCVYLIAPEHKGEYQAPGQKAGKSNVGFAASRQDVADRLNAIWQARAEGHEIASHACGHFDGADWSQSDWTAEFGSFQRFLRDAYSINGIEGEPQQWRQFATSEIKGFRAPYLSTDSALYRALPDAGFAYDASGVSRQPVKALAQGGIIRFSLPQIPEGPKQRPVIAMDYNIFVRHSAGFERADQDGVFEQRAYEAFLGAFDRQYRGERTPLEFGFHFTLMNDGAYWRALERFAAEVCPKPDVACVSYRDYIARNADIRAAGTHAGG